MRTPSEAQLKREHDAAVTDTRAVCECAISASRKLAGIGASRKLAGDRRLPAADYLYTLNTTLSPDSARPSASTSTTDWQAPRARPGVREALPACRAGARELARFAGARVSRRVARPIVCWS